MGVITGLVAAGAAVISSGVQAISANQKAQAAKGDVSRAKSNLEELESSRQDIVNPYENMENLSDMASDTSGNLKNRFANIGVATQAAEMQIEEADIALANTLDTLAATGASAGGATALAQAALQSKKGVSASIEQQEVANQQKAAQAEMQIDQSKMSEQQRLQNINMSEAKRMQNAEAQGADYVFKATEVRQGEGLDRAQTQVENAQGQVAANQAARDGAIGSAIGGLGNVATAVGGIMNKRATASTTGFTDASKDLNQFNVDTTIKPMFGIN
jgi:hypothetical protein